MSQTIWATRMVNGVSQRKEFGRVQWDMLRRKDGSHDGWVEEGAADATATNAEVKQPFVPREVSSRGNVPQAEKDALNELDKAINRDDEAKTDEPAADGEKPKVSADVDKKAAENFKNSKRNGKENKK